MPERTGAYSRFGKRVLDLVVAIPACVVAAPLSLAVALAIRCTMGPEVLFRQLRPGRNEKPFVLAKFRTMSRREGTDAERLTALGRFLRTTSLDELPQLLHVITGRMSLVGPRPLLPKYLPYYTPRERRRFALRPGLTGWSQVQGRNDLAWDARLELDAWYVDHCSLGLDLSILVRTLGLVMRRRGARADPRAHRQDLDIERETGDG